MNRRGFLGAALGAAGCLTLPFRTRVKDKPQTPEEGTYHIEPYKPPVIQEPHCTLQIIGEPDKPLEIIQDRTYGGEIKIYERGLEQSPNVPEWEKDLRSRALLLAEHCRGGHLILADYLPEDLGPVYLIKVILWNWGLPRLDRGLGSV